MSKKIDKKILIIILIFIGFFVYLPSFFNSFVWDDEEQIVNNYTIRSIKNIPLFFSQGTFNPGGSLRMGGSLL